MRMARWGDLHFGKSFDFLGSEIYWSKKNEIWSEMGPYGSVGAHIKTGRSHMAQDHFKTPPDPKMAHENPKMTQKSWLGSCWDSLRDFIKTTSSSSL